MTFTLTDASIDAAACRDALVQAAPGSAAGGIVTFEGVVRALNLGRAVVSLEYEAYAALAIPEGERIAGEARARFAVEGVLAVHRTGRLALGETAVWVGVAAAHRGAAFDACRFVIDEIKARVPIWKREHYADGPAAWVGLPDVDPLQTDPPRADPPAP